MKSKAIVIAIIAVLLLLSGLYFFYGFEPAKPSAADPKILIEADYPQIAKELRARIDDLSPTPPTTDDFFITELEFVKASDLVYITYHDTRNIFRILVEVTGFKGQSDYIVKATFEQTTNGWKKKFGNDLGAGSETEIFKDLTE